ncbi:MAG: hypothetical protein QHH80_11145 [Anaerolineae bacterium]|nr:hypothetical protein [Anaerolineae bacterium]
MSVEAVAVDTAALESSLRQVKGVFACRVVMDAPGEIGEIHVVGAPDRKPKQIVRDIESLLFAKFGLRVNYRKISLAQMQEEKAFAALGSRPRLLAAECASEGDAEAVRVRLADNGNVFEGVARHPKGDDNVGRAACLATLDALNRMVTKSGLFTLDALEVMPVANREIVIVMVTFAFAAGEEHLIGTSFYRGDIVESAVRATLDSVNRRLSLIRSL